MKTLLTGGAGYIGSHTALAMLDAGHEVVIVDNFNNSSPEAVRRVEEITGNSIRLYEADVADKAKLSEILTAEMPDCIIHFAGYKAVGESVARPVAYYRNNIDTTLTLLECMEEAGTSNVVFSSSATVYGENNLPPFTEETPRGLCTNPYGWTKWMQEQILTDAHKASLERCRNNQEARELSVVLLRYFNPVGAHESGMIGEDPQGIPNNLMPYISQVAVGRRDRLTIFGGDYDTPDGTCRRDYIHVMDLAEGHVKAAEFALANKGVEIFNLGTGKPLSVLEMVHAFGEACGHELKYEIGERRPGDIQDSWANVDKARNMLGWNARRGIEEICVDSWKWQSQNPQGYECE